MKKDRLTILVAVATSRAVDIKVKADIIKDLFGEIEKSRSDKGGYIEGIDKNIAAISILLKELDSIVGAALAEL